MDRRRFLQTSLASALVTPLTAEAQPAAKVARIGFLSLAPAENTTLMKALAERRDVLIAGVGTLTALALRAATSTIPIVFR
jgi:hypothetical protein